MFVYRSLLQRKQMRDCKDQQGYFFYSPHERMLLRLSRWSAPRTWWRKTLKCLNQQGYYEVSAIETRKDLRKNHKTMRIWVKRVFYIKNVTLTARARRERKRGGDKPWWTPISRCEQENSIREWLIFYIHRLTLSLGGVKRGISQPNQRYSRSVTFWIGRYMITTIILNFS